MRSPGRKILFLLLAVVLLLQPAGNVNAEEDSVLGGEMTEEEILAAEEEEKQESYGVVPDTNAWEGWAQGPNVYGASAIVMDMKTHTVLYGKKIDEQHYPASITKLLTTLVALENAQLSDNVTFSEDSVAFLEYGDASIGMTPGEILTLNDGLYGLLLASANEVAYAVAENVGENMGGDYSTFIREMNRRSQELGCTGSHWVNANGLHDEEHYTTAYDMALIASEVYQREEFLTIMQSLSYTIPPTNLVDEERVVYQNHKMLWPENYYYDASCTGGKTGYTDQAKTTLVTMSDNGDMQLAAVVLYDYGTTSYDDTRAMLDYAFANFSRLPLEPQDLPEEAEALEGEAFVTVPNDVEISDLEKEITITEEALRTGIVTYRYHGHTVGSVAVTLTQEYVDSRTKEPEQDTEETQEKTQEKRKEDPALARVTEILVIAAAAVVLLAAVWIAVKKRQRRRRHRRK